MQNHAPRKSLVLLATVIVAFECAAADRRIVLPIKLLGNFPVVTVTIEGKSVPLVFDSGNSGSLALTQAVLDAVKAIPTGQTSRGMDPKGNIITYPKYTIHRVQIGTAVFTEVVAELDVHDSSYQATQVGQQGFLGTSLVKGYQVILDYPHRRMTLVPPGSPRDLPGGCTGTVVPFSPQWHGEPAAEADTDLGRLVMWWDTGSPTSALSQRFVQKAGSNSLDETVMSKRFTLGGSEFGPWQFDIWDLSLPPGFDGFIGYNFFANHIVCMDFPGHRLLIQHGS